MDANSWIGLIQNFGVAVVILLALGVAGWRVLAWTGRELVLPFRDKVAARLAEFLDRVDSTRASLEGTLAQLQASLARLEDSMESVATQTERQTEALAALRDEVQARRESGDKTFGPASQQHQGRKPKGDA